MEKVFETLTGAIALLLIIATMINFAYLMIFFLGLFVVLTVGFYSWEGECFADWIILSSLVITIFAFVVWIGTSIMIEPVGLDVSLSATGGALFPSIAISAYLESKR